MSIEPTRRSLLGAAMIAAAAPLPSAVASPAAPRPCDAQRGAAMTPGPA